MGIENQRYVKILEGFWLKCELKIVLVLGFIAVAAVSFEFGALQGQKWQSAPVIIEKSAKNDSILVKQSNAPERDENPPGVKNRTQEASQGTLTPSSDCAYVGSKNSKKYYLPTCSWAKQIKPENKVCFKSAEEAQKQGRTETKCGKS